MRGFTRLLQTAVLLLLFVGQALGGNPTWTTTNYTNSTTITAVDSINYFTPSVTPKDGDYIGAFVGTECRMVAKLFTYNGKMYISGVIQGGMSGPVVAGETATNAPEEVTFKLWAVANDAVTVLKGTTFTKPGDHIEMYPLGKPNSNADLKSLAITGATISPAFAAATQNYTASASSSPALASYVAVVADSRATVAVTVAKDLTSSVVADRTATIVVTAENGKTTKTYTVVYAQTACTVAAPTATNVTVCANDAASKKVLTATGLNGATFAWYSDAAKSTKLSSVATYAPTVAGTYYVAQTTTCEGATQAVVYTVNTNPVATLTGDKSYCSGGVTLTASANSLIYEVGKTAALSSPFTAGSYIAVATSAEGCKDSSDVVSVTANTKPTYTIAGGGSVCKGATGADVTVTLTGTAPFKLKYAINGISQPEVSVTSKTYTITPATTAAGTVVYTLASLSDASCSADIVSTESASVTVKEATKLSVTSTPACTGGTATLTATGVSTNGTVTWTSTANAELKVGTVFESKTTIDVLVYQTVDGCKSEAVSATATINANPTVTISLPVTEICKDATPVAITLGSLQGGSLIIDGIASTATTFDPSKYAKGSHNLKYVFTASNNCKDSAEKTITVNQTDSPVVTPTDATIQVNAAMPKFTATGSNLIWKEGTNVVAQTPDFTPNFTPDVASTHTYSVTQTLNGCVSPSVTVTLTVTNCKTSQVSLDKETASICFGSANPSFTATGNASATAYTWYDKLGGTPIATTATYTPTVTASGTYEYFVTQTVGCEGTALKAIFTINALPVVKIDLPASICKNETLALSSYGTGAFSGAGVSNNVFTPATTGNVTITYSETDANNCTATTSDVISVKAVPSAPVITVTPACSGSASTMTATGTNVIWTNSTGIVVTKVESTEVTSFSATQTVDGCVSEKATASTVINAIPSAPAAADVTALAGATSVKVSAAGETGNTITWYNGSSILSNESAPTLAITTLPTSFTVTQKSIAGCESPRKTVSVTESVCGTPAPSVEAASISVCEGTTTTLKATTGAAQKWYDANLTKVADGASFEAGVGSWYVSSTENGCEGGKTSVIVSKKTITNPTLTVSAATVKYNGSKVLLTGTPTGGTYSTGVSTAIANQLFNPSIAGVGTHTITYTVTTECGDKTASATIVVENADLQGLKDAIKGATDWMNSVTYGTTIGTYPTSAKTPLQAAIDAAQAIVDKGASATPTEITSAIASVNKALETFKAAKNTSTTINKAELEATIASATTTSTTNVGIAAGQHPVAAQTALKNAITIAQAVADTATKQGSIDAAKAELESAITTFTNTVNPGATVVKTALETAIATATTASTTNVGTAVGQHPVSAQKTLVDAIKAANDVLSSTTATQTEVNNAVTTLNNAVATFNNTVNPATAVDKTLLETAISNANAANTNVGTAVGQHPVSAQTTLVAAIGAANAVFTSTTATQEEVNSAITTLNSAVTTFNNTVNPAVLNTKELTDAIAALETIIKEAKANEGTAFGKYPTSAITTAETALAAANAALKTVTNATEVSNAATTAKNATTALSNAKSTTPNSIEITKSTGTPIIGKTLPLVAVLNPIDATAEIVWSTSDATIATVKANGDVTFLTAGTVIITATVNGTSISSSQTFSITPSKLIDGIQISVFPVPTVSVLNIKGIATVSQIEISSVTGVVSAIKNNGDNAVAVEVANLTPGIYNVKLIFENGQTFTTQFTKL